MNIKIISDSRTISQLIQTALKSYGHEAEILSSKLLNNRGIPKANLLIIDTRLEFIVPCEFIEKVLTNNEPPHIIGINSKGSMKERLDFIRAGVEVILNYPFPLQELIARLPILENRENPKIIKSYNVGGLTVKPLLQEAYLADRPIALRKKEFGVLSYLVRNKERPISRSELLDNIWDYRKINSSNTVDVHINRIRDKLAGGGTGYGNSENKTAEIKTVYGFGYQIKEAESV
jgi:DNA-binding response OmpR family regulator